MDNRNISQQEPSGFFAGSNFEDCEKPNGFSMGYDLGSSWEPKNNLIHSHSHKLPKAPSQGEGFSGGDVSTTVEREPGSDDETPSPGLGSSAAGRMLANVEIITETGCWIFMGGLSEGYGIVSNAGPRGTAPERAHRLSYQHFNGPVPKGLFVCHRCDIRCCCNPHHLFLGTQHVNNTDMADKGRSSRGEDRPTAKLTEEIVRAMRARHATGESISSIARLVGVSVSTARKAIRGLKWRHV